MKKIAPDLVAILGCIHEVENPSGGPEFDPAVVARARLELRALLAVAEAARTYRNCQGNLTGRAQTMNRKRLGEALARLEEEVSYGE